uniref:Uncharacterized protein n=1 Tax=Nelumbo nucifera TaxID=4432 RepID=A0A823A0P3_NELNU|nr:TPA_asm: hypothetical protein HUJ06_019072 [Nelumbo nucifera]
MVEWNARSAERVKRRDLRELNAESRTDCFAPREIRELCTSVLSFLSG